MAQATLLHGDCVLMVDHTPGSAVSAGDVIVTNDSVRIAHSDIAANALGALAAGGGVYTVAGDAAIAADKVVRWDDTNNKVSETAVGTVVGRTVTACAEDAALCAVIHDPGAVSGDSLPVVAVAAAGSAQGDAAALTGSAVNVVSAADGTKGVILPAVTAGAYVEVYTSVATNGLKIYPATGDDINDGSANAAITIEGKTHAIFRGLDTSTWAAVFTANT
jgi:predicted RecA/RadA family phage recombinase